MIYTLLISYLIFIVLLKCKKFYVDKVICKYQAKIFTCSHSTDNNNIMINDYLLKSVNTTYTHRIIVFKRAKCTYASVYMHKTYETQCEHSKQNTYLLVLL